MIGGAMVRLRPGHVARLRVDREQPSIGRRELDRDVQFAVVVQRAGPDRAAEVRRPIQVARVERERVEDAVVRADVRALVRNGRRPVNPSSLRVGLAAPAHVPVSRYREEFAGVAREDDAAVEERDRAGLRRAVFAGVDLGDPPGRLDRVGDRLVWVVPPSLQRPAELCDARGDRLLCGPAGVEVRVGAVVGHAVQRGTPGRGGRRRRTDRGEPLASGGGLSHRNVRHTRVVLVWRPLALGPPRPTGRLFPPVSEVEVWKSDSILVRTSRPACSRSTPLSPWPSCSSRG